MFHKQFNHELTVNNENPNSDNLLELIKSDIENSLLKVLQLDYQGATYENKKKHSMARIYLTASLLELSKIE
ncbi:MAG: hypothetical protein DI551_06950 [Micavibrio aeruginosavorus]|uniref:Uncharacterized protein n=1 Tax=Micavibrio aeruginosavorus TaxID=349221 RepID=A0A2W5N499_9BACT|nr:MAG: hypothetical protein DI551_06950 [Micavibrio aeruginosavorus]